MLWTGCTTFDDTDYWCRTGDAYSDYGYCADDCPKVTLDGTPIDENPTECLTVTGADCFFPFDVDGFTFTGCSHRNRVDYYYCLTVEGGDVTVDYARCNDVCDRDDIYGVPIVPANETLSSMYNIKRAFQF